jgi:beta-lactamase class A
MMGNNIDRREFLKYTIAAAIGYLVPSSLYAKQDEKTPVKAQDRAPRSSLEQTILDEVRESRQKRLITSDETVGFYVYDLTSDRRLVNINGDDSFQAASMVKPLVALAYYHQVKIGRISESKKDKAVVKDKLRKMLVKSNNSATNWFIDKIGGAGRVDEILNNDYGNLFQNTRIVEKIPPHGQTYKNKVALHDYSRFLYALIKDNSPLPGSDLIQGAMGIKKSGRIYYKPRKDDIFHKTGTTGRLVGDMGVVDALCKDGKYHPYIFIGAIEKTGAKADPYKPWFKARSREIKSISKIVNQYISNMYT